MVIASIVTAKKYSTGYTSCFTLPDPLMMSKRFTLLSRRLKYSPINNKKTEY